MRHVYTQLQCIVCATDLRTLMICVSVVPSSGFTQRATLDPELHEIHVLTVMMFCSRC